MTDALRDKIVKIISYSIREDGFEDEAADEIISLYADLSADLVRAALEEAGDALLVLGDVGGHAIIADLDNNPEAIAAIVARVTEGK